MNVMETTQLDFSLKILIFPFGAPIVGLDLQVMEHVKQFNLSTVAPIWPFVLGLDLYKAGASCYALF
jgi:hypothetical protein